MTDKKDENENIEVVKVDALEHLVNTGINTWNKSIDAEKEVKLEALAKGSKLVHHGMYLITGILVLCITIGSQDLAINFFVSVASALGGYGLGKNSPN